MVERLRRYPPNKLGHTDEVIPIPPPPPPFPYSFGGGQYKKKVSYAPLHCHKKHKLTQKWKREHLNYSDCQYSMSRHVHSVAVTHCCTPVSPAPPQWAGCSNCSDPSSHHQAGSLSRISWTSNPKLEWCNSQTYFHCSFKGGKHETHTYIITVGTRLKFESWKLRIHTKNASQSHFYCFLKDMWILKYSYILKSPTNAIYIYIHIKHKKIIYLGKNKQSYSANFLIITVNLMRHTEKI